MDSTDFYLAPMTMSYFFLEALEKNGYAFPKGWRSHAQNDRRFARPALLERTANGGSFASTSAITEERSPIMVEDITAEATERRRGATVALRAQIRRRGEHARGSP